MIPIPQLHLKLPVKPFSNCLELFGKEKEIDLEVCHSVRPRNVTHTDDAKIFLNRSLNFLSSVSLDDGRVGSIVVVSKSIPTYFIVRGLVIIFIVVHEPSNSCNKAAKGERQADLSGIRYYNESLAHIKHRSLHQKMNLLFQSLVLTILTIFSKHSHAFTIVPLTTTTTTRSSSSSSIVGASVLFAGNNDDVLTTTSTFSKNIAMITASSCAIGMTTMVLLPPTQMAYAATTAATVVTTTATAKKAPKVSATPAAAVPGPKKALDAAKSNLVSITEQRTRAISDVRAAKSAADQLRNTEVTAQKAAQQAKTSYLNANDRYVSMKNVKDKSTISTKSLTDQKYKVGTCEPLLC